MSDERGLGVEPGTAGARERLQPGMDGGERRVDERRVDPQRQRRITGLVGAAEPGGRLRIANGAGDRTMEAVEAPYLAPRLRGRPVHDPKVGAKRAGEPRPGIRAEV